MSYESAFVTALCGQSNNTFFEKLGRLWNSSWDLVEAKNLASVKEILCIYMDHKNI